MSSLKMDADVLLMSSDNIVLKIIGMITGRYGMDDLINYKCPTCGTGGANPSHMDAPLCHACDYKVEMTVIPSHNLSQDIDGRPARMPDNYLDPVTYVPNHANGNAGHIDCELGVIINITEKAVFVLYCKSRTIQSTNSINLVWG